MTASLAKERVGAYELIGVLGRGGMATVHVARAASGDLFAVKRIHPQYAGEPEIVAMLVDEAALASRVRHPNVVAPIEIVRSESEVALVLEYVRGVALSKLLRSASRAGARVPPRVVAAILCGVLRGLHAAHEARGDDGAPLGIVHRDVTPENILVAKSGVARLTDFGVAKARGRSRTTKDGVLRGKIAYMAPEQLRAKAIDRRVDVFAAGVVLWEMLTLEPLFDAPNDVALLETVLTAPIVAPGSIAPDAPPELDEIVMRALERDPPKRFDTALDMARAIEAAIEPASAEEVAAWARGVAGASMDDADRFSGVAAPSPPNEATEEEAETRLVAARDRSRSSARRKRGAWIGAAAALAALAALFSFVSRAPSQEARPSPNAPAPLAVAAAAPAVVATDAPKAAPVETAVIAPAVTAVIAPAVTASTRPASVPRSVSTSPRSSASAHAARDCNPPFWIDAEGHKQFKPECL